MTAKKHTKKHSSKVVHVNGYKVPAHTRSKPHKTHGR